MKKQQLVKRLVCGVLIALSTLLILYAGIILINKSVKTSLDDCSATDRDMFFAMEQAISAAELSETGSAQTVKFERPVLVVEKGGIRGNAYLFNMPITEHSGGIFNMNMGLYAQEIVLGSDDMLSPYRMSVFTPGLGSLIFMGESNAVRTVRIDGVEVLVIPYDGITVANGTFAQSFGQYAIEIAAPAPEVVPDEPTGSDMPAEGELPEGEEPTETPETTDETAEPTEETEG